MLSPLLYNMFINNLVETIKGLGIWVDIGQEKVSILMYADDLVLLAETKTIFSCYLMFYLTGAGIIALT